MNAARPTRNLARLVLAWFVLALGIAVASPLIKPQSWHMVCSASGVVKLVSVDADGAAQAGSPTVECPLCWLAGAPPPAPQRLSSSPVIAQAPLPAPESTPLASRSAPPLPARGPPAFS